ncbi:MAG: hypothetical protein ACLS7Z_08760 [Christensenellales bacterium]
MRIISAMAETPLRTRGCTIERVGIALGHRRNNTALLAMMLMSALETPEARRAAGCAVRR